MKKKWNQGSRKLSVRALDTRGPSILSLEHCNQVWETCITKTTTKFQEEEMEENSSYHEKSVLLLKINSYTYVNFHSV